MEWVPSHLEARHPIRNSPEFLAGSVRFEPARSVAPACTLATTRGRGLSAVPCLLPAFPGPEQL